jgi:hypothetical protein
VCISNQYARFNCFIQRSTVAYSYTTASGTRLQRHLQIQASWSQLSYFRFLDNLCINLQKQFINCFHETSLRLIERLIHVGTSSDRLVFSPLSLVRYPTKLYCFSDRYWQHPWLLWWGLTKHGIFGTHSEQILLDNLIQIDAGTRQRGRMGWNCVWIP